ncbi:MAG TPA: glycosyltransferase family 4 protein [Stellaceae bacterium]|jgi:glycosyltransferase involved in cell wall biosynthesis|nr:glycosyltransferase family 4 protein [Stellaceae bacterium]
MSGASPKLLYLVTEDWYFWSHRLPMARAALAAGFKVGVATRVDAHGERIRAEGFALHPLRWRRGDFGLVAGLRAITEIHRLYRRERPDLVHHISVKPAVYGGLAAFAARIPAVVSSLTGMGYSLASAGLGARMARLPMSLALRLLLAWRRSVLVIQNEAHRATLLALAPKAADRVVVIRGSGVDTRHFAALPDPSARPIAIGFVGRLLADKGVRVLIDAYRRLLARGVPVRLVLAGVPDPESPTSISDAEIKDWLTLSGLTWLGQVSDVRQVWAEAHIAVLPSFHEGLPKSLLEAAACARPIVATDIPGCREVAIPGRNALLVPVGDAPALADAIERLARDDDLRRRLGAVSRSVVEPDLSDLRIGAETVALYRRLAAQSSVVA